MGNVENIERQIEQLTPEELAAFRQWFADFDADAQAGKLDALAEQALQDHQAQANSE